MSKYVVVDLEMCKVPKHYRTEEYHWGNETIQIGAVLVDDSLEIMDKFMTYVCPEHGVIDFYIESLTGIRKADVQNAPKMKEALEMFTSWIPEDAVLVSWSENDELQIRREMQGKDIQNEKLNMLLDNGEDCQITFSNKMDTDKKYKLEEALIITDIDYDVNIHDALVDAYNTALLFVKTLKEDKLQMSKYYLEEKECEQGYTPFGELFKGLQLGVA